MRVSNNKLGAYYFATMPASDNFLSGVTICWRLLKSKKKKTRNSNGARKRAVIGCTADEIAPIVNNWSELVH
jgi:hypothetical protein